MSIALTDPPARLPTPYAVFVCRDGSTRPKTRLEALRLRVRALDSVPGHDLRTDQELLGHQDVRTTMICTHVLNRGLLGVPSPIDTLPPLPEIHGPSPRRVEKVDRKGFREAAEMEVERPGELMLPEIIADDAEDVANSTSIRAHLHGMKTWGSLFNARQIVAMQKFVSCLLGERQTPRAEGKGMAAAHRESTLFDRGAE